MICCINSLFDSPVLVRPDMTYLEHYGAKVLIPSIPSKTDLMHFRSLSDKEFTFTPTTLAHEDTCSIVYADVDVVNVIVLSSIFPTEGISEIGRCLETNGQTFLSFCLASLVGHRSYGVLNEFWIA